MSKKFVEAIVQNKVDPNLTKTITFTVHDDENIIDIVSAELIDSNIGSYVISELRLVPAMPETKKLECWGCANDCSGQTDHMGVGGCLYVPSRSQSSVSASQNSGDGSKFWQGC